MTDLSITEPVDYLLIGHVTQDLTAQGPTLGGTATYAALTAKAFNLRVGVVTSCRQDLALEELNGIHVYGKGSRETSTFINTYTPAGRIQHVKSTADPLSLADVPTAWRNASIVHLGPVLHEIEMDLVGAFSRSMVGLTPQGWLREWNAEGLINACAWSDAARILSKAQAAVISVEDVHGNEEVILEFAQQIPILVVTEGAAGARVFWNGDQRTFRPPEAVEVDPVGAGDIFAASFFIRYQSTHDAWEAARFANLLASKSVTRKNLTGIPTGEEIKQSMAEIIEYRVL
jgi:sugar/nucleoside kinase (ribokinase family)